jgi:hypothetical protein
MMIQPGFNQTEWPQKAQKAQKKRQTTKPHDGQAVG